MKKKHVTWSISIMSLLAVVMLSVLFITPGCPDAGTGTPVDNCKNGNECKSCTNSATKTNTSHANAIGGINHANGYLNASGCKSCHGSSLEGQKGYTEVVAAVTETSNPPCCYSCHDKLW